MAIDLKLPENALGVPGLTLVSTHVVYFHFQRERCAVGWSRRPGAAGYQIKNNIHALARDLRAAEPLYFLAIDVPDNEVGLPQNAKGMKPVQIGYVRELAILARVIHGGRRQDVAMHGVPVMIGLECLFIAIRVGTEVFDNIDFR